MNQYDVFFATVKYIDRNGEKNRPVIFIQIDADTDEVFTLPIFSYKKWFDINSLDREFIEILDLESAGLNRRSFADISRPEIFDVSDLKEVKIIGHLSNRDIESIVSKL